MDKLPQLESCCCGCSLRTGTKIIGWLGLIGSILLIAQAIAGLVIIGTQEQETTDKSQLEMLYALKVVIWVVLVIWFLSGVINFVLLLGVHMEKPKLVRAYCIICLINIIITIFVALYSFGNWSLVGRLIANIVFQIYFFLVVNSYYRTMGGEGRNFA